MSPGPPAAEIAYPPSAALLELSDAQVYAALSTSASGLSGAEAARRLSALGPNELPHIAGEPLWRRLERQFTDLFALLLLAASAVTFAAYLIGHDQSNLRLAIAIVAVVILNAGIGFGQEYMAERTASALKAMIPERAQVMRSGHRLDVAARELVRGDVLFLEAGDSVPCDARLVEAHQVTVDNSALTGESRPALRQSGPAAPPHNPADASNLVFMGTTVLTGAGQAVAIATGLDTEFGSIYRLAATVVPSRTPLQIEVAIMARRVAVVALAFGTLVFFARLATHATLVDGFLFSLGVMVALVPEGLPATLSASLALGVRRMAQRRALVKRLLAVEALGSVTVICTDKTGTITSAEMTASVAWESGRRHRITGSGFSPEGEVEDKAALLQMLKAASLCSNATLVPPERDSPRWRVLGDPTEGALLVAAVKAGFDLERLGEDEPRTWEYPFDPDRKLMSSIHRRGGGFVAYVKGAPQEIVARCRFTLWQGRRVTLDAETRERAEAEVDRLALEGLRVLAVAETDVNSDRPPQVEAESGLVLLGLVGILDPPRPGVAEAISACRRAGIRVYMLSGDHGLTALAIGRQVGLVRGRRPRIVYGGELSNLSEDRLVGLMREGEEIIFARLRPEHKLRIVTALKAAGEVVAVTGDGANDAPALRRADVGVAMGIRGTDAAREASQLILLDDSFATIAAAVELGRSVYQNIRKFLIYLFSHNLAELAPILAAAAVGFPLVPLSALQVLAIDLGSDVMPALALGLEPPEPGTMDRPPRTSRDRLFSLALARRFLFLGAIQSAGVVFAFFWKISESGLPLSSIRPDNPYYVEAMTMTQAGIVVSQFFNGFSVRTELQSLFKIGLFSNWRLVVAEFAALGMMAAISYWPPLQGVFHTGPLTLADWGLLFGLGLILFGAEEARKFGLRRRSAGSRLTPAA